MHAIQIALIVVLVVIIVILARNWWKQMPSAWEWDPEGAGLAAGDLLLFRHNDANFTVRAIFGDEFSHVGVVVADDAGALYVSEAVSAGDLGALGDESGGVKCVPLAARLASYDGYVCAARLRAPLSSAAAAELWRYSGWRIANDCQFCEYAHGGRGVLRVAMQCLRGQHEDLTSCAVCSSHAIGAMKAAGIVSANKCEACYRPQTIYEETFAAGIYHAPMMIHSAPRRWK